LDVIVTDESVDGVGEGGESLCGPFRKAGGGDGEASGRPFLELPGVCAGPLRLLAVLPMARPQQTQGFDNVALKRAIFWWCDGWV